MRARARQLSMRRYRRPQWRIGCQHAKVAVTADAFVAWLALDPNRSRDEFVLVSDESASEQRILKLLLAELPLKTAVKLTADITGGSRNELYDAALALKKTDA